MPIWGDVAHAQISKQPHSCCSRSARRSVCPSALCSLEVEMGWLKRDCGVRDPLLYRKIWPLIPKVAPLPCCVGGRCKLRATARTLQQRQRFSPAPNSAAYSCVAAALEREIICKLVKRQGLTSRENQILHSSSLAAVSRCHPRVFQTATLPRRHAFPVDYSLMRNLLKNLARRCTLLETPILG